jgi:hypothetical protein
MLLFFDSRFGCSRHMGFTDTSIGGSVTSVCAIFFTTLSKHYGLCNSLSSFLDKTISVLLNHWLFDNLHQSDVAFKRRVRASCSDAVLYRYKLRDIQHLALVQFRATQQFLRLSGRRIIVTRHHGRRWLRQVSYNNSRFGYTSLPTKAPTAAHRYHRTS